MDLAPLWRVLKDAVKAYNRRTAAMEERNAIAQDLAPVAATLAEEISKQVRQRTARLTPKEIQKTEGEKAVERFVSWRTVHWQGEDDAELRGEEVALALEALHAADPMAECGISPAEAQKILDRHGVPRSVWKR